MRSTGRSRGRMHVLCGALMLFLFIFMSFSGTADAAWGHKKRTTKGSKGSKNSPHIGHASHIKDTKPIVSTEKQSDIDLPESDNSDLEPHESEEVPDAVESLVEEEDDSSLLSELEELKDEVVPFGMESDPKSVGSHEETVSEAKEHSQSAADAESLREQLEVAQSRINQLQKELESSVSNTDALREQLTAAREEAASARQAAEGGSTTDLSEELAAVKEQLHSEQERYSIMLKRLKVGSNEMERQLGVCQTRLQGIRSSSRTVEETLRHNVTELATENKSLQKRIVLVEDSLQHAKQDLDAHVKGFSLSELEAHQMREKLRTCEDERQDALAKVETLDETKIKNTKLTKLGNLLRTRLAELEEEHETLTNEEQKIRNELGLTKDVCDQFKAIAEGRAPTVQEAALVAEVKDQLSREQEKLNTTSLELEECIHDKSTLEGEKYAALSKVEEREHDLEDAKVKLEKQKNVEDSVRSQLRLCEEDAEDKLKTMSEREKLARQEARNVERRYHEYKEKVDDPALFDYVVKKTEWLQNPELEGLNGAYNKTLKLFGPRLTSTEIALIEMQAYVRDSSQRLTKALGKPEYSPIMSGILTYGILLIPLLVSLLLVVRLRNKISLAKWSMWATIYNVLFCGFLFGLYKYLGTEPLSELRSRDANVFEFLQFSMAFTYSLYCLLLVFVTFKHIVKHRCAITLRMLLQCATPLVIGGNYYALVWKPVMLDSDFEMDGVLWMYYSIAFSLLLLSLMGYDRLPYDSGNSPGSQEKLAKLLKSKNSDGEGEEVEDVESGVVAKTDSRSRKDSVTRQRPKKSSGGKLPKTESRRKGRKSRSRTEKKVVAQEDASMVLDIVDPSEVFEGTEKKNPKMD